MNKLFHTGSAIVTTRLELPFPPSLRQYYRSAVIAGSVRVYMSAEGKEYRKDIAFQCLSLKRLFDWPHTGRLGVEVALMRKDKRKYDLDNHLKALLDALQHAGVFLDDSQIDDLRVTRGPKMVNGMCVVYIKEVEP